VSGTDRSPIFTPDHVVVALRPNTDEADGYADLILNESEQGLSLRREFLGSPRRRGVGHPTGEIDVDRLDASKDL